ncbi:MAG: protease modulator HflC, partial [Desulfobacterales bacterium]
MKYRSIIIIALVIVGLIGYASAFIVDETEQVVVTRFGKVARQPIKESGLNFKLPFIEQANYFPKNLLQWDGDPGQIPTLDKTYIWVDTFARWKIVDPIKFFQTVNNITRGQGRLDDIIDPAVRNLVTQSRLIETVRKSNREMDIYEIGLEDIKERPIYLIQIGREEITKRMLEQAQPKLAKFGIELVDVKIKRINYVEEVR